MGLFYLSFSGFKGFNQFEDSSFSSAMENSQAFFSSSVLSAILSTLFFRNCQESLQHFLSPDPPSWYSFPQVLVSFLNLPLAGVMLSIGVFCDIVVKIFLPSSFLVGDQLLVPTTHFIFLAYASYAPQVVCTCTSDLLLAHYPGFSFSWALFLSHPLR